MLRRGTSMMLGWIMINILLSWQDADKNEMAALTCQSKIGLQT